MECSGHFATLRFDRQNGEKQHILTATIIRIKTVGVFLQRMISPIH
jgi:hypothetical protein